MYKKYWKTYNRLLVKGVDSVDSLEISRPTKINREGLISVIYLNQINPFDTCQCVSRCKVPNFAEINRWKGYFCRPCRINVLVYKRRKCPNLHKSTGEEGLIFAVHAESTISRKCLIWHKSTGVGGLISGVHAKSTPLSKSTRDGWFR